MSEGEKDKTVIPAQTNHGSTRPSRDLTPAVSDQLKESRACVPPLHAGSYLRRNLLEHPSSLVHVYGSQKYSWNL